MTNEFFYISSGAKNAMRTLRHVSRKIIGRAGYSDQYVCNLARDWDEAVAKSYKIIGSGAVLKGKDFDLNEWGQGTVISRRNEWAETNALVVEGGEMPFGKHAGTKFEDLPEGYVKWWVDQMEDKPARVDIVAINKAMLDTAENRGLVEKWDADEKAEQEAIAKMEHLGEVGERYELFLRCDKVLAFHGHYGTTFMNICKTREGNEVIYKGTKGWNEGTYYHVKARVKAHKDYEGKPQTFITRPTIIKTVEKES